MERELAGEKGWVAVVKIPRIMKARLAITKQIKN